MIESHLDDIDPDKKLVRGKIINSWNQIVGETIAKRTQKIYIIKTTLYVQLDSAIIKSEVYYIRQAIIEKINKQFGEEIIKKIVFK